MQGTFYKRVELSQKKNIYKTDKIRKKKTIKHYKSSNSSGKHFTL